MNWIRIPNHEKYEINELGFVRFLGGTSVFKNGRERYYPPRDCKLILFKHGYCVSCDGKMLSIAKLVAMLFCDNPKGFKQFYHIDGDIKNNVASNIKWGKREKVIFEDSHKDLSEKEYLAKYYFISSNGAIIRKEDKVILKPSLDAKGYLRIRLKAPALSSNKDKRKAYKVHRLVAMFYLDNYSENLQVNHINGDKKDNRVENLEMVTASENVLHAWRMLYPANSERRKRLKKMRNNASGRFMRHRRKA